MIEGLCELRASFVVVGVREPDGSGEHRPQPIDVVGLSARLERKYHDFRLFRTGMPSKVSGTASSTPKSLANSAAMILRFESLMPRLNRPIVVNGQMSLTKPVPPPAY